MGEIVVLDDYRKKREAQELEDLRRRVDEAMSDAGIYPDGYDVTIPEYTYITLDNVDDSLPLPLAGSTSWPIPTSLYSSYGYYSLGDDDGS